MPMTLTNAYLIIRLIVMGIEFKLSGTDIHAYEKNSVPTQEKNLVSFTPVGNVVK
jgi:hypothetical protein